jgi:oligopeptide transport system substrate-binding protein
MTMLRPTLALTLLFSLATTPLARAQRETPVEAALRTQTLYLGNGAEPADLDPQITTAYTEYNILIALFEGLTVIDEATSQPIAGAAERWDISPDGLTYTFHLRENGRWSNGEPVTAQDFVTSYQRILSPALAAEYAYMLFPLKNAEVYNAGKLTDFAEVGARARDARTLELTLARPTPYLLSLIAHQAWFPVHPPTILQHGRLDQRGTRWTQPGNLVGNGAFVLKEWKQNARILVEKNPTYWNSGHTRLNAVVFFPNDNLATDEQNFRAGQLHVTYDLLPEKIPAYRRQSPSPLRIDPFLETFFIRFNVTRPPLDNKKLRQALARALDRDVICRVLLHGSRAPAHFFTPPNTAGYNATANVPSDFEAARRLLAEAGFPQGRGLPQFELQMNTDAINKKVLEAVQQMWRRELGVNVRLINNDFRVYLDNMRTLAYDISRARWVGDYNNPTTYLDMFVTGGGNNQTGWSHAEYDRLIAEAGRTAEQNARCAILQKAEALLLDEAPIAPVFFGNRVFLIHPSVKGWVPSLLGIHRYQNVWLE